MAGPSLAFIGFGEAASAIAKGLGEAGLAGITAFDVSIADDGRRTALAVKARDAGVTLAPSLPDLLAGRDVVISAVTADSALAVAESAAPLMAGDGFYVDINSVSPETKRRIAGVFADTGVRFVEAAVMAAVPKFGHRVPILLAGPQAGAFIETMAPFAMDLEDAGPDYGVAAATKMFRSIMVKGLEGLLWECVLAADQYGAAEEVLKSVEKGYPGIDWNDLASYLIGRTAIHGERRAHEMDEVAATLRAMDIDPFMAEAAAKRIRWAGRFDLKKAFDDAAPEHYEEVLACIRAVRKDSPG